MLSPTASTACNDDMRLNGDWARGRFGGRKRWRSDADRIKDSLSSADRWRDGGCRPGRMRLAWWLAPMLCIVAIVVALCEGAAVARSHAGVVSGPSSRQEEGDVPAGAGDESGGGDGGGEADSLKRALPGSTESGRSEAIGTSDGSSKGDGRAGAESADAVTLETFLMVLEAGASGAATDNTSGAGSSDVSFEVTGGLVTAAEGVLRAYRARHGAQLLASGYLDLKGNVWGAIVWDGAEWVDIVIVAAGEDDAMATVRVVRHRPPRQGEDAAPGA